MVLGTSVWSLCAQSRDHCHVYGNIRCDACISRSCERKRAKVDCPRVSTTTAITRMAWIKTGEDSIWAVQNPPYFSKAQSQVVYRGNALTSSRRGISTLNF
jgi:hypothetical protein